MAPSKTATLNLRIDPNLKEAIRIAAKNEHRSIANIVEVLIREHCERVGIPIPEQGDFFGEE
jgi:hypothetical protein